MENIIIILISLFISAIGFWLGYQMHLDQKWFTDYWHKEYTKMKEDYFKLLEDRYEEGDEWKKLLK